MGVKKEIIEKQKENRLGEEKINYQKCPMIIVKYNRSDDIVVEFQDKYKGLVHTSYYNFLKGKVKNPNHALGEERYNNQGCLMKIVEYGGYGDIVVEFQDKHMARVHTAYNNFLKGGVKNPYCYNIYEVGAIGVKYPITRNKIMTKEYDTWRGMLRRSFSKEYNPAYEGVTCCEEWLLYENFYEWLHSQENFDKWLNGKRWAVDKDILKKGNKIYSPETCCLVPQNVNNLFTKHNISRGNLPIGVNKNGDGYRAACNNPFTKK